jgi:hypothetical protein
LRGRRVVLDADLARVYGVTTSRFNEAFKRNRRRFPDDFVFQLTVGETADFRSQFAISSSGISESSEREGNRSQFAIGSSRMTNRSQFVTGSQKHRDPRFLPWAFTEHGAIMAANILRSDRAVQMSVYVVRAFVRLREHIAANQAILRRLAEIDKSLLEHDAALRDIYEKLLPLLEPPPENPPTRRIGFQKNLG